MQTKEYHSHDKSGWPDGEWMNEPDKKQWKDEDTGLPCLIVRNNGGALCGYVGVYPDHPFFEKDYDKVHESSDIEVHGGLTFSDSCREEGQEDSHICHADPDDPRPVWWLGFDCSHAWDISPIWDIGLPPIEMKSYKNIAFVENEIQNLAKQLSEVRG